MELKIKQFIITFQKKNKTKASAHIYDVTGSQKTVVTVIKEFNSGFLCSVLDCEVCDFSNNKSFSEIHSLSKKGYSG